MEENGVASERPTLNSLSSLKFKRTASGEAQSTPDLPSTLSSATGTPSSYATPPPQSRDSSVPSKYFGADTPSRDEGNVLVPSSSPIRSPAPPAISAPVYQSYALAQPTWTPSQPGGTVRSSQYRPPTSIAQPTTHHAVSHDPLTASSFTQTPTNNLAQFAYRPPNSVRSKTPPQPVQPSTSFIPAGVDSPGSPDIIQLGQRKRKRVAQDDHDGSSSEESASRAVSRLTKKRPGSPPESSSASTPQSIADDAAFMKFKMTCPLESLPRIKAAWEESRGDTKKATLLLLNASWSPKAPSTPSSNGKTIAKATNQSTRVVNTQAQTQKADMNQRKMNSAIYAGRNKIAQKPVPTHVPPSTPPVSRHPIPVMDLTGSPASPNVILPKSKKSKKIVLDSDSEPDEDFSDSEEEREDPRKTDIASQRTLDYFNNSTPETLQELTGCTVEQARTIISFKPFESFDDLKTKLGQGKKKAGPGGISSRLVDECQRIMEGYGKVDSVLSKCESIGNSLKATMNSWSGLFGSDVKDKVKAEGGQSGAEDGGLSLTSLASLKKHKAKGFISSQPKMLPDGVQLKEYQLLGLNWLNLLYTKGHSCILADEMGLGKTIQVISFLALLKEQGHKGPYLIVVPASTLENWCREFQKFAPEINVQTYYAGKKERVELQHQLIGTQMHDDDDGWEVLVTTYTLAQTDGDRRFLRKFDWQCTVFDEGHMLKNNTSQRYQQLMKISSNWKLLLTGTPLQNNLQELVSLMNFVMPEQFEGLNEDLNTIFKAKGDSKALLARERITRAKQMLTPFVLRRRKDQVLQDLPKKTERIEFCEMNDLQRSIYADAMQRSRKTVYDLPPAAAQSGDAPSPKKKPKPNAKEKLYLENSSNVLMDLRKASSHPMLFRTRFTDETLSGMAKTLLKEPDFKKRGAIFDYVKEDMSVMTDAELQVYCGQYKSLGKYSQENSCFEKSGKVDTLLKLVDQYRKEDRKILVFSQFTQILDIIQVVLEGRGIKYLVLTGSTPVDARQSLVDEFGEDDSIPVFLLSTKAGGMGINLTAASVVILFDQDFNPHNDRQAQDRAYRIGQKRNVDVIKLITRNTIEEDMLRLGQTKLALDAAVAGDSVAVETDDSKAEEEMKVSLLTVLRQKYQSGQESQAMDVDEKTEE